MHYRALAGTLAFCAFSLLAQPKAIICDLGGVLLDTHMPSAFWHVGPAKYLAYAASTGYNMRFPRQILYQTMNAIRPRNPDETLACDCHGFILPQLMCDWLKGTQTPAEILTTLQKACDEHPEYFICTAEKNLFLSITALLFEPSLFISTRTWLSAGLQTLDWIQEQGYKVYLLSNWDAVSFSELENQYGHILERFDGILISGDCGLIKPDPAIFELLLKTYQLQASDCMFLDDQPENVAAAQSLGIESILIQNAASFETFKMSAISLASAQ